MSVKQALARLLDRRGCRRILASLSTLYARHCLGVDFELTFHGTWVYRANGYYYPRRPTFDFDSYTISHLIQQEDQRLTDTNDYWFPFFRPPEGGVIVDVGAGRAEDLPGFLQAVGKAGKIIAIEAHPRSFADLQLFCELNQLNNVTPLHVAVMDHPSVVELTDLEDWESNAVSQQGTNNAMTVRADSLDNICEAHGIRHIDFLKMNIEGAERLALLGMSKVASECRAICIACHDFRADRGENERFRTRAFVESFLSEKGFRLVSRATDPRDYVRDHIFGFK